MLFQLLIRHGLGVWRDTLTGRSILGPCMHQHLTHEHTLKPTIMLSCLHTYLQGVWKMPTGLAMQREDIGDAAEREVHVC